MDVYITNLLEGESVFYVSTTQRMLIGFFLLAVGMYGVYVKAGEKNLFFALVPFINYVKLGDVVGMPKRAVAVAVLKIIYFGTFVNMSFLGEELLESTGGLIAAGLLVLLVICTSIAANIIRLFLFIGLIDMSGRSRWYILFFFFLPDITFAIWGISRRIKVAV